MSLESTQPLVKMSTRNIPGGKGGRCIRLTTYHHTVLLLRNLEALTSQNPVGLLMPVTGQLYPTHRLMCLKSHMDTNWIYISRNRAHYRLSLCVRLHVTLPFGGPRKSRRYLKTIFQTHFLRMFYMNCQQIALVNLFLRSIQKHSKPALCRGMLNQLHCTSE